MILEIMIIICFSPLLPPCLELLRRLEKVPGLRKTLKPCSPSIQTKDLMTSKQLRTSDAADKVDPKRACIVVNFQLLYHSAANSSSIKSRILMSKRSISNVKPNLAIGSRTTLGIWPWNCSGAIWSNFPTPC